MNKYRIIAMIMVGVILAVIVNIRYNKLERLKANV